jgi:hypothetical protein
MQPNWIVRQYPLAAALAAAAVGCNHTEKSAYLGDFQPKPLGTISDPIWQVHESNAEADDFVVHEHEWVGNTVELNAAGVEHVKQIAARAADVQFPVIVERSSMSPKANTQYQFPVHGDEELDMQRRQLITQALAQMGVENAESRVLVAPAMRPGFLDVEGERAIYRGILGGGMGGFGGGFGGMGGGFGGGFGGGAF